MLLHEPDAVRPARIVVGLDFRDPALAAGRWIIERFGMERELVLAHVVETPEGRSFHRPARPPHGEGAARARERAEAGLRGFAATHPAARLRLVVRVGAPHHQLARIGSEEDADIIALGRSEERFGAWTRIGRITERLLRRTTVPVLVLDGRNLNTPETVIAAIDDAKIGAAVVRTASRLARHFGARLVAMHVVGESAPEAAPATPGGPRDATPARGNDALQAAAHAWLWRHLRAVHPDLDAATTVVAAGSPGREILKRAAASRSAMLVVGRHGAHAEGQAATGGVTRFVLRGAECPVLVVPETAPMPSQPRPLHRLAPALAPSWKFAGLAHEPGGESDPPAA